MAVDLFDALVLAHEEIEPGHETACAPYVSVGPKSIVLGGYLP